MSPNATTSSASTPSRAATHASPDAFVTPAAEISTSPLDDEWVASTSPASVRADQRDELVGVAVAGDRTSSLAAGCAISSASSAAAGRRRRRSHLPTAYAGSCTIAPPAVELDGERDVRHRLAQHARQACASSSADSGAECSSSSRLRVVDRRAVGARPRSACAPAARRCRRSQRIGRPVASTSGTGRASSTRDGAVAERAGRVREQGAVEVGRRRASRSPTYRSR